MAFYVHEHNHVLPHSAFRGRTPDEMYFGTGMAVPAELASRAAAELSHDGLLSAHNCRVTVNLRGMCRNITALRGLEPSATPEEISAAALQYVRKVAGISTVTPKTADAVDRVRALQVGPRRIENQVHQVPALVLEAGKLVAQ